MSLDGARLKVVWAQKHLNSLQDAIRIYTEQNTYVVDVEEYIKRWFAGSANLNQPEPQLSAIVGDVLHNLACSLDYVMWEVAGTFAGRVLSAPPPGKDKPYFPIWDDPDCFDKYIS